MTDTLKNILPWQHQQWQQLWRAKQQGRLPHAFILVGENGLGKKQFASCFASAVLCQKPTDSGERCGVCHACHLLKAKSHSDLLMIEPEEKSQNITVDQIREMVQQVNETTLHGGYRVIIIHPASAMNMNAANALLKTLEEPAANTLIILIADLSLRLPATILSRCQKIIFQKPDHAMAQSWLQSQNTTKIDEILLLKLADGAPLKALSLLAGDLLKNRQDFYQGLVSLAEASEDPLLLAAKWQTLDSLVVIDLLLSWVMDLCRLKMTQDSDNVINDDYLTDIKKLETRIQQTDLFAFLDQVQQMRGKLLTGLNLNKQLLLEELFIRWTQYVSC